MNINGIKTVCTAVVKNKSAVATTLGIAGGIATTVLAVKQTPKAMDRIDNEEFRLDRKLTLFEKFKIAGPVYAVPAATGVASIASILWGKSLDLKAARDIAGMYAISNKTIDALTKKLDEYNTEEMKEDGVNLSDFKKEDVVREIHKDHVEQNPEKFDKMYAKAKEDKKCIVLEPLTGQEFIADMAGVKKAINRVNDKFFDEDSYYNKIGQFGAYITVRELFKSLNEVADRKLNIPTVIADRLGWESRIMYSMGTKLVNDVPVLTIIYTNEPVEVL